MPAHALQALKTYCLPLVMLLAVALRVAVVLLFPSVFAWDETGVVHGSDLYDKQALNLLETGVYGYIPGIPDASVPPLYGFLVAALYSIFGRGYLPVITFHILLDLLSILCLCHIGRRVMPRGESTALVACLAYACYPYLIFQNLTLIDTPVFMLCLNAFLLALVMLRARPVLDSRASAWIALAGVSLGLGVLCRPIIAPLGIFGALWFLLRLPLRQTILRLAPVAILGALITVPWIARNYAVYQAFVPMGNNGGMNFWFGNSQYTIPFLRAGYHPQWATPDVAIDPNDQVANAQYMQESLAYLRAHPEKIPELAWVKFLAHWSIDVYPGKNPDAGTRLIVDSNGNLSAQLTGLNAGDPVVAYSQPLFDRIGRAVHILYFGSMLVLALIGIILTARYWRDVSILWFVQISATIMYVIFIPATRYRVPTDPLLFLFSAYTLVFVIQSFINRTTRIPKGAQ